MKSSPENADQILNRFDEWLRTEKVQPKADFVARTRHRIQEGSGMELDPLIDRLLQQDRRLYRPDMAARVREKLRETDRKTISFPWFQWASPIAAAAVLGFAFFAFQSRAPEKAESIATQQASFATNEQGTQPDSELTQIFALASNLEATTDLSRLQSVDNFAFLLE